MADREPPETPAPALLTSAEVAALFRVDAKTVSSWARRGNIRSVRTLGGHRRYPEAEVRALLGGPESQPSLPVCALLPEPEPHQGE